MKDLPLNALRAFAIVYANGGVRAAARELGIAHSSVSRHLAELESWLGITLTEETSGGRRGLVFTPHGEKLGKATLAGLREIEQASLSLREVRPANAVTISTAPSFATRWLLPRLPKFEHGYPKIEVSIHVDQRIQDIETAGIDIAIRIGRGPWPDLRCEPLMDDELYPVMSPTFWEKSGRPKSPQDLRGVRLLHDRDPNASWGAWREAFGPESLNVQRGPRFASSDLVLRAAAQGQGVALARHRLAMDDLYAGVLVRPINALSIPVPDAYWLVLPRHSPIRKPVHTFLNWLKAEAARGK